MRNRGGRKRCQRGGRDPIRGSAASGRRRAPPSLQAAPNRDPREGRMSGRRVVLATVASIALAMTARAEDAPTFPAGGVAEALKARAGKPVTLQLASGTQIGGTVAEVRDHAVVL